MKIFVATSELLDGLTSIQLMPPAHFDVQYGNAFNRPEMSFSSVELVGWFFELVDKGKNVSIKTTSMLLVDCVRLAVKQERVLADDVEIRFVNGRRIAYTLRLDADGRYTTSLPTGYFDTHRQILRALL